MRGGLTAAVRMLASVIAAAAVLWTAPGWAEQRLALVIGNGAYKELPLKNPPNDARAMASTLRTMGFEVMEYVNLDQKSMTRAITKFGEMVQTGGVALFYYAGHGMQVRGKNFLIPVDAEIASEASARSEGIDVDVLLDQLGTGEQALNIVILDACRNNPYERRFRGSSGGLAQMDAPSGTLIAYATAPGKVANDGDGANGLYTQELLRALKTPGLKVEEVFKKVRVQVSARSNAGQIPWEASSLTGEFYFLGPTTVNVTVQPPAGPPAQPSAAEPTSGFDARQIELAYWESIKSSSKAADYEAYLRKYPKGDFADLAKNRLNDLKDRAQTAPTPPSQLQAALPAPTAPVAPTRSRGTLGIGIDLPLTGADAEGATRIKYGAEMAIDEANAAGGVAGYKLDMMILNDATPSAGQYDPAQAAANAKKFVSDPSIVAAIGPEMSGAGKAMSPILSAGDLATITPSSTNPDITDPRFAGQYRPAGKAIYFRTLTTDAYQGPSMANYMKQILHVQSVYILDDSGAYGVGIANAFEARARSIGIQVQGHDQLNPRDADYTAALTRIGARNPDAIYYGGVAGAGVKFVKQSYGVAPKLIRAGGDGVYGPQYLSAVGFPAAEGLYATNASPHVVEDAAVQAWVARFARKYSTQPDDYALTAYDAGLVVIDAIKRVAASGREVTRSNVRDAIQSTRLRTLQGEVSFDQNGDISDRVVSVFQIRHDARYPDDDMIHQYRYVGAAPQ